jgi:hypothetical protein
MTVIKNKSTAYNREFWSHVEAIAEQSRAGRDLTMVCSVAPERGSSKSEIAEPKERQATDVRTEQS